MIIESIRLKNIKSYGEGPQGNGVTISLQPGINRIGGRNGHGKSTLIESLGYALFVAEPEFEEKFQIERYLLNHGAKEGEIDVTFRHGEESYRVERGVGRQSKRRSKVIQISDGSICAENDLEVARFLCDRLGFPNPARLGELFSKLIGVKQGRLTWPFDSKPAEAKRFFEPLLDVAVFRECFDQLKPVVESFEEQWQAQAEQRAAVGARMSDRADSREKVAACRQALEETGAALGAAKAARDASLQLKNELERLEMAAAEARLKADQCDQGLGNARKVREVAEQAVNEARAAAGKMGEHQAACNAYREATALLEQLESKRAARDTLKARRDDLERTRSQGAAKGAAARAQAAELIDLKNTKASSRLELEARAKALATGLETTKEAFEEERRAAVRAGSEIQTIRKFVAELAAVQKPGDQRARRIEALAGELAGWDTDKLIQAEANEVETRRAREGAEEMLARARERLGTLSDQLREIAGGRCPFLKERCRQFDPAKVTADVEHCRIQIKQLESAAGSANESHLKAKAESERLKGLHNQRLAKRSALETAQADYILALRSIVPEKVDAALAWLLEWEKMLVKMPRAPICPARIEPAETVRAVHEEFAGFARAVSEWWESTEHQCRDRLDRFRTEEMDRQGRFQTLQNLTAQLAELGKEAANLEARITAKQSEATKEEATASGAAEDLRKMEEQLKPFAGLDAELAREGQRLTANRAGYESYLGAKEMAEQLEIRTERLTRHRLDETGAATALEQARTELAGARAAFDPEKLQAARAEHQSKHDAATRLAVKLEAQEKDLKAEEARFREWQQAGKELAGIGREMGRCQAAIDLTELARRTLRDAAPEVARHLCHRIAQRAQRVFNQINPEPIELEWEAEHYSLRAAPGDRRFAMLSGGEQTKLALAMTLAMIEEFSGLHFCVFDEPTYGVDADSRQKLADTILEAQQAAGLEQLLLVSHDDAFEGKIEHSVILKKTIADGTLPSND